MKISQQTIAILRNFASINRGLVVEPGNIIKTGMQDANLKATAVLDDVFPKKFAIYDLPKLLSLLSLFEDPEILFEEQELIVTDQHGKKLSMRYGNADLIKYPSYQTKIVLPTVEAQFDFTEHQQSLLMKSMGALKTPQFAFVGDGSKIYATNFDTKVHLRDTFSIEVGTTDRTFTMIFDANYLKQTNQPYHVSLCFKGMAEFTGNPTYWLPTNEKSKYDGV